MQTRLTDRCPESHLSTGFTTKAATNAAPSNRALDLPLALSGRFSNSTYARGLPFHGLFYRLTNFVLKTAQLVSLELQISCSNQLSYAGVPYIKAVFSGLMKRSSWPISQPAA